MTLTERSTRNVSPRKVGLRLQAKPDGVRGMSLLSRHVESHPLIGWQLDVSGCSPLQQLRVPAATCAGESRWYRESAPFVLVWRRWAFLFPCKAGIYQVGNYVDTNSGNASTPQQRNQCVL